MEWSSSDALIKFLIQKIGRLWFNCFRVTQKIDVDVMRRFGFEKSSDLE